MELIDGLYASLIGLVEECRLRLLVNSVLRQEWTRTPLTFDSKAILTYVA
jgi:hypothetical protein